MKKIYTVLTSVILFFCLNVYSQIDPKEIGKLTDVLPASPDVSAIVKSGGIPVNHSTGSVYYSLPLLSLTSGKISVNTNLSYNSNGIKVDEIASRVGLGWSLNAGGVISRMILDDPDEDVPRISAPSNLATHDGQLLTFLKNGTDDSSAPGADNGTDNQPDIFNFSFNGFSGRFILDAQGNIVQLPKSNLKIEKDFFASVWNFKITDPTGVTYFFGGSTATETTKTENTGSYCGRTYATAKPTAWYLTKIVHPNGDFVQFNYLSNTYYYHPGVNQTMMRTPLSTSATYCQDNETKVSCPDITYDKTCVSYLKTSGYYLSEIVSSKGEKISLEYQNNRADLPGEVSLARIELKNANNVSLKSFLFTYEFVQSSDLKIASSVTDAINNSTISAYKYRMYLRLLSQSGVNNTLLNNYSMKYYSAAGLPSRLSFAQDHYGYYNGVNNSFFVGTSELLEIRNTFNNHSGDREPNPAYSSYGLLSSITYPTGGMDSILYEGHTALVNEQTVPPLTDANISVIGTDSRGVISDTLEIAIEYDHTALFTANCTLNPNSDETFDGGLHNFARVELKDITTNTVLRYWAKILPDEFRSDTVTLTAGHIYRFYVRSEGEIIRGIGNLNYRQGASAMQVINKQIGGVRVAGVKTFAATGIIADQKKYHYAYSASLSASSGEIIRQEPEYYSIQRNTISCNPAIVYGPICLYNVGHSNSLVNLFGYGSSPVYYNSVLTSFGGDNFEGGGEENHYSVEFDITAYTFTGTPLPEAPYSDFSWKNGFELYRSIFKKDEGSFIKLHENFNHYKVDGSSYDEVKGYYLKKDYDVNLGYTPPQEFEFGPFHGASYTMTSAWMYLDSVKTIDYDSNGLNPVTRVKVNEYNSASMLLKKSSQQTSKGQTTSSEFKYSSDYSLITPLSSGQYELLQSLSLAGNISAPVEVSNYADSQLLEKVRVEYKTNPASGRAVRANVTRYNSDSDEMEVRVEQVNYDDKDNLLSQRIASGISMAYELNATKQYMVASIKNASNHEFFHQNFEEFDGASSGQGHTGTKFITTYQVNWVVPNSRQYKISYWFRNNNLWKYKEESFLNNTHSLSGGDAFDDIIVRPHDAEVTTYTYEPLVGMTSQIDPRGETTYYEYDSFQRLHIVRDQHRNIVKTYCYNYAGQLTDCSSSLAVPEPESPPVACSPISTLPCNALELSLPVNLTFNQAVPNTIADNNSQGLGFTMVQAYSGTRLTADGTVSNGDVPGYEASKLTLVNGQLQIVSNKGIAYLTNNNQLNALGVKFNSQNNLKVETVLINPFYGTSAQQAGIWMGQDDGTFIKLVVVGNKLEFRKEVNNASTTADMRETAVISGLNTQTVTLRIEINQATQMAEAFYSVDGTTFTNVGSGYPVSGLSISGMGLTGGTTFAGIFATHRNSSTAVTYSFDSFNISVYPLN